MVDYGCWLFGPAVYWKAGAWACVPHRQGSRRKKNRSALRRHYARPGLSLLRAPAAFGGSTKAGLLPLSCACCQ